MSKNCQFKEDALSDKDTMYINSPILPLSKFKDLFNVEWHGDCFSN